MAIERSITGKIFVAVGPKLGHYQHLKLNRYGYTVSEIRHSSNDREVTLVVKSARKDLPCRICDHPTQGHGIGHLLRLRHLPLLGKKPI